MRFLNRIIIIFFIPVVLFSWGDKGHKVITRYAMKLLPPEINLSLGIKNAIVDHSVDADKRKRDDISEPQKHFIDIDFYKEFLDGRMIQDYDSLCAIYRDSVVIDMGILPWATETTYNNLIDAFKMNDKSKIILYASDLAHYVGDGHQPLHTTLNYNGQMTNQKGIHFRYEIEMFDKYVDQVEKKYEAINPQYVSNVRNYIFDYISDSNSLMDLILTSDRFANTKSSGKNDQEYYRVLWNRTQYITSTEVSFASYRLASLIYSAWIDAGKPDLDL